MTDTRTEFEAIVARRYAGMGPLARMQAASSMHETAVRIVSSSLPDGLDAVQRRIAIARRFYGNEFPESAYLAHAHWTGHGS